MKEYSKIQSIYKRDEKTHKFINEQWSLPEFEYLQNNEWVWTEKIDGTNIRVSWDGQEVQFSGRTDNAQVPIFLLKKLQNLFLEEKFLGKSPMTLYGEGYGAKIQKGGGNYISDGVDFILFDILVDVWWLKRDALEELSRELGIDIVPIVGAGTIHEGIELVKNRLESTFGPFLAEGIVLKPAIELQTRGGHRIITKMKHRDFV